MPTRGEGVKSENLADVIYGCSPRPSITAGCRDSASRKGEGVAMVMADLISQRLHAGVNGRTTFRSERERKAPHFSGREGNILT